MSPKLLQESQHPRGSVEDFGQRPWHSNVLCPVFGHCRSSEVEQLVSRAVKKSPFTLCIEMTVCDAQIEYGFIYDPLGRKLEREAFEHGVERWECFHSQSTNRKVCPCVIIGSFCIYDLYHW